MSKQVHVEDPFNEYGSFAVFQQFPTVLRQKIILFQVVPDNHKCYNVIFVTKCNQVYAFGHNSGGCLGLGHNDPVLNQPQLIDSLKQSYIVQLAVGNQFVVALNTFGMCWAWGLNANSQLPFYATESVVNTPTLIQLPFSKSNHVVSVVCGHSFGAMLTSNGEVFTFGDNKFGQLAVEQFQQYLNQVPVNELIGEISCGAAHLVMVTKNGKKVYVNGDNRFGQLGLNVTNVMVPKATVNTLVVLKNMVTVKSVSCGQSHTLILLSNGIIYAFGDNRFGQLGVLPRTGQNNTVPSPCVIEINELFSHLYTSSLSNLSVARSTATGRLYIWGSVRKSPAYTHEAHNDKIVEATKENITVYRFKYPRQTYMVSVSKLYALYEPKGLYYNEKLSKASKILGREKMNAKLFNKKPESDVCFYVNGKPIWANKSILATYSHYFHRAFRFIPLTVNQNIKTILETNESDHCSQSITIRDYPYRTYYTYLRFLYTGSIEQECLDGAYPTQTEYQQLLVELVELAELYQEADLFEVCFAEIYNNQLTDLEMALRMYNLAIEYQVITLMKLIADYIGNQFAMGQQALVDGNQQA